MDFIIWFVGNFFTIIAIGALLILIISLFYDGLPLPNQKNEVIYDDQNDKEDDEVPWGDDEVPWGYIRTLKEYWDEVDKTNKEELWEKDLPNIYKYSFIKYDDLWNEYVIKKRLIFETGGTDDAIKLQEDELLENYYHKYKNRYEDEFPLPKVSSIDFPKLPDDEIKRLEKLRRNKSNDKDENLKK